jgi:chromosome segregation ATPase
VSNGFGLMIESLVAALLLLTIGYCMLLNKRLKRLRSDEQSLKATISELITATEIAERAIAGLKMTVRECDHTLGERLRTAERFSSDMERQLEAGGQVLSRLSRIAGAARGVEEAPAKPPAPPAPDTRAVVAAAQAFAERTRLRSSGMAA